ncbi:MAG: glycosyltransferase [archaeon]
MRVLFYAVNGMGLGHIMRSLTVAKELDAHTLFVTNSVSAHIIEEHGFPYVRLPLDYNQYTKAPKASVSPDLASRFFNSIILDYSPDVIVYDTHYPSQSLEFSHRLGVKNVLILRRLADHFLPNIDLSKFSRVLVAEHRGLVNLPDSALSLPNVSVIGPIVRTPKHSGYQAARPIVLVTAGGGGQEDADQFIKLAKGALSGLDAEVICIGGPNSGSPNYEANLPGLMQISRLVIAQAGYNTVNEIIQAMVPSILIPGDRDSEIQNDRAEYLQKLGGAIVLNRPGREALAARAAELLRDTPTYIQMKSNLEKIRMKTGNRAVAEAIRELSRDLIVTDLESLPDDPSKTLIIRPESGLDFSRLKGHRFRHVQLQLSGHVPRGISNVDSVMLVGHEVDMHAVKALVNRHYLIVNILLKQARDLTRTVQELIDAGVIHIQLTGDSGDLAAALNLSRRRDVFALVYSTESADPPYCLSKGEFIDRRRNYIIARQRKILQAESLYDDWKKIEDRKLNLHFEITGLWNLIRPQQSRQTALEEDYQKHLSSCGILDKMQRLDNRIGRAQDRLNAAWNNLQQGSSASYDDSNRKIEALKNAIAALKDEKNRHVESAGLKETFRQLNNKRMDTNKKIQVIEEKIFKRQRQMNQLLDRQRSLVKKSRHGSSWFRLNSLLEGLFLYPGEY